MKSDLTELREEARASARKVRWKKVIKRFEKQIKVLAKEDVEPCEEELEGLVIGESQIESE